MQPIEEKKPLFPLAGLLLGFLRNDPTGKERYRLGPEAETAIACGLDGLFTSGSPIMPVIDEVVKLSIALDEKLGSPTAALRIRAALAADARVCEALGHAVISEATRLKALRNFQGEQAEVCAPSFGQSAPKGTVELRSLARPFDRDRARAAQRSSQRPNAKSAGAIPR
jgi:hypothetical protein